RAPTPSSRSRTSGNPRWRSCRRGDPGPWTSSGRSAGGQDEFRSPERGYRAAMTAQTDAAAPGTPAPSETGYREPAVDVESLTRFLDGKYADVRQLVRDNLVEHVSVLNDADTMDSEEFRERVLEVVQEMSATGQTAMGLPREHGGGGDIGASIAA